MSRRPSGSAPSRRPARWHKAICITSATRPVALAETPNEVGDLQRRLENSGVELAWPDEAIQTILDQKEAYLHT